MTILAIKIFKTRYTDFIYLLKDAMWYAKFNYTK